MSWQERLRQMVLAGGVLVAGCGGEKLGASGTGGNNGSGGSGGTAGMPGIANTGGTTGTQGTGGAGGAPVTANTGGSTGTGGGFPFACGNANPDPCICGRPEAGAAAADLCLKSMACKAAGGELLYNGNAVPICERDGAVVDLSDGAAPKVDGAGPHVDGGVPD